MAELYLVKTMHFRKSKETPSDYMLIIESVDGKKRFTITEDPTIKLFITKEKYWTDDPWEDHNEMFVPLNTVDEHEWKYRQNYKELHDFFPNEYQNWYKSCMQGRDWEGLKQIYKDNRIHGADIHIEDHYMGRYLDHYKDHKEDNLVASPKLHKAYWDIEVKIEDLPPGMSIEDSIREAPAPIDAISLYSDHNNTMYSFLLRVPDNPLCVEFEENLEEHRLASIERFKLDNCVIIFFDDEIELLNEFFSVVNVDLKPDFMSSWNQGYDFRMTRNRISRLRYTPEDFFCPEEIPHKKIFYYEDNRNWDPAKKSDYAEVAGYTNYCDQMLTFASLRATMGY